MVEREVIGPFGGIRRAAAAVAGMDPKMSFVCHRCLRVRRYTRIVIFCAFGLLAVLCLVLERMGLI